MSLRPTVGAHPSKDHYDEYQCYCSTRLQEPTPRTSAANGIFSHAVGRMGSKLLRHAGFDLCTIDNSRRSGAVRTFICMRSYRPRLHGTHPGLQVYGGERRRNTAKPVGTGHRALLSTARND